MSVGKIKGLIWVKHFHHTGHLERPQWSRFSFVLEMPFPLSSTYVLSAGINHFLFNSTPIAILCYIWKHISTNIWSLHTYHEMVKLLNFTLNLKGEKKVSNVRIIKQSPKLKFEERLKLDQKILNQKNIKTEVSKCIIMTKPKL